MKKLKVKKKVTPEEQELIDRRTSFQERLPIVDIRNNLFVTKDGRFLPVFAIGQKAIDLMAEDELAGFAKQIEIKFASMGLKACQFLLLPVPFDLEPYKRAQTFHYNRLDEQKRELEMELNRESDMTQRLYISAAIEQNEFCRNYLADQARFVANKLQTGLIANKHSYLVCEIEKAYNERAVIEAADLIEDQLRAIAGDSRRCSEREMELMLITLFNPLRPEIYTNR